MEHLKKLFSLLQEKNPNITVYDLVDILDLAKNLTPEKRYTKVKEICDDASGVADDEISSAKEISSKNQENQILQRVIDDLSGTKETKDKTNKEEFKQLEHEYKFDTAEKSNPLEVKLDTAIKVRFNLFNQFKLLRKKLYINNQKIIDEEKTADYIAYTKQKNIIFKPEEENYFSISIIIDQSGSMFLWEEVIKQFIKELKQVGIFKDTYIYYLDTEKKKAVLYYDVNNLSKTSIKQEIHLKDKRNLKFILSDCTSLAWKSNDVYTSIIAPMSDTLLTIVQMLPNYMWLKSTLGKGDSVKFYSQYEISSNKKLNIKDYYSDDISTKTLKLPIISIDDNSFLNYSKTIMGEGEQWLEGIVLNQYDFNNNFIQKTEMSIEERYNYFLSVASVEAQKLAIYCSVLPLKLNIIEIIQSVKNLKKDIKIVAEFYFGKIIHYNKETKEFKYYEDNSGSVRAYFRSLLSTKEAFNLAMVLSDEIQKSFNLPVGYKELFYGLEDSSIQELSKHDKELIDIFIDILNARGGKFREKGKEITVKLGGFTEDYKKQVIAKLSEMEICDHVGQEVYIGGDPREGDYILQGEVSQCGGTPEYIKILDVEQIDKNVYSLIVNFELDSYIEIYDFHYPRVNEEAELVLDINCTLEVSFEKNTLVDLKIENINIDTIDYSQLDSLYEKYNEENPIKTEAIIPTSKRFMMGSKEYSNEQPAHEVVINYDFEIAKYPVTVGEFRVFVKDTGYKTEAEIGDGAYVWDGEDYNKKKDAYWDNPYFEQTDEHPVVCISWNDAKVYCKWLSKKTGENYRLPTEAEWEFACRAGTTTKFSFGDDEKELEKYAWYSKNSNNKTHPVGEKLPNPWGLYDMHGNVWEWCEDDWVDNYNNTPTDGKPYISEKSDRKVLRGGSWGFNAYVSRSAGRGWINPGNRGGIVGFRLLRTLPSDLGDS